MRTDGVSVPGVIRPVRFWYRDLVSCLYTTFATVLLHAGEEPLSILGLVWEFLYKPGDVRPEEFYVPCRFDGDLARTLAPYQSLRSRWWCPTEEGDPLREVEAAVAENHLLIAAVDNYHLPFRPAYKDVHSAHLVVVYGVDQWRGEVHVSDAMPPAFCGPVPVENFLASWSSTNPRDARNPFFSNARIGRRCLSVELDTPFPPLDPARLLVALRANLERFGTRHDPDGWGGLSGLEAYTAEVVARARVGEARTLEELYTFGWGVQAQASLHGELLRTCGTRWDVPEVCEAGRAVESAAHAWTGLRITAAHGRTAPRAVAGDLARHGDRLRARHEEALNALARAGDVL